MPLGASVVCARIIARRYRPRRAAGRASASNGHHTRDEPTASRDGSSRQGSHGKATTVANNTRAPSGTARSVAAPQQRPDRTRNAASAPAPHRAQFRSRQAPANRGNSQRQGNGTKASSGHRADHRPTRPQRRRLRSTSPTSTAPSGSRPAAGNTGNGRAQGATDSRPAKPIRASAQRQRASALTNRRKANKLEARTSVRRLSFARAHRQARRAASIKPQHSSALIHPGNRSRAADTLPSAIANSSGAAVKAKAHRPIASPLGTAMPPRHGSAQQQSQIPHRKLAICDAHADSNGKRCSPSADRAPSCGTASHFPRRSRAVRIITKCRGLIRKPAGAARPESHQRKHFGVQTAPRARLTWSSKLAYHHHLSRSSHSRTTQTRDPAL